MSSEQIQTRVLIEDAALDHLTEGSDASEDPVQIAVELLRQGDLVALPTETVYGLGADALNPEAVARIFEVKERPYFDPLICHISHFKQLHDIAYLPEELDTTVRQLTNRFWPGPLTLILPKKESVPDLVTSGLPTVAVRLSAHPFMRAVIKELGHPVAAPSANRFGRISPTSAQHVYEELGGKIPLIIDSGACNQGIESTIISISQGKKRPEFTLLRPGPITKEELQDFGKVIRPKPQKPSSSGHSSDALKHSSKQPQAPGQLDAHYAPQTPLYLFQSPDEFHPQEGKRYGLLTYCGAPKAGYLGLHDWAHIEPLSHGKGKLVEAAVRLFHALRYLDSLHLDAIIVEPISEVGLGVAIMDRLRRAAYGSQQSTQ